MSLEDTAAAVSVELGRSGKLAYFKVTDGWLLIGAFGKVVSLRRHSKGRWSWRPYLIGKAFHSKGIRPYGETVREVCAWLKG